MKHIAAGFFVMLAPAWMATPAWAQVEDAPSWDCRTDGNQVCGPDSGHVAGQYVEGQLIPWPHEVVPAWCKDICLGA